MKKTALITGATSGIGLELAKIHAQQGDNLVLCGRSFDKLNDIKTMLEREYKTDVSIFAKDLAEPNAANDIYNFTQLNNKNIYYLINNAGFGNYGAFEDCNWNIINDMIQVNIKALTQLTHLYIPHLKKNNGGKIMNVSSIAAFQPGPMMAIYFATKAFVLHFSEAIADELKHYGISVTALCPGPTESNFFKRADMLDTGMVKGKKLPTSAEVAKYGYDAMMRGKSVAIHGFRNKLLVLSVRFAPRSLVVKLVRMMQSK